MTIVKTGADAEAPGRFGRFGGRYVPETLMSAVTELEESYAAARADKALFGAAGSSFKHVRRTPDSSDVGGAADRAERRGAHLSET